MGSIAQPTEGISGVEQDAAVASITGEKHSQLKIHNHEVDTNGWVFNLSKYRDGADYYRYCNSKLLTRKTKSKVTAWCQNGFDSRFADKYAWYLYFSEEEEKKGGGNRCSSWKFGKVLDTTEEESDFNNLKAFNKKLMHQNLYDCDSDFIDLTSDNDFVTDDLSTIKPEYLSGLYSKVNKYGNILDMSDSNYYDGVMDESMQLSMMRRYQKELDPDYSNWPELNGGASPLLNVHPANKKVNWPKRQYMYCHSFSLGGIECSPPRCRRQPKYTRKGLRNQASTLSSHCSGTFHRTKEYYYTSSI